MRRNLATILLAIPAGCASTGSNTLGIPRSAISHCEAEAPNLLSQYEEEHGPQSPEARFCAEIRLKLDCEAGMSEYANSRRNPMDGWFSLFPGMWDEDAFESREERLAEAFSECGTSAEQYKALKILAELRSKYGGKINWPTRGRGQMPDTSKCKACQVLP